MDIEKARDLIKRQLWSLGHKAKDVSDIVDYDLLVNDKIRVKVIMTVAGNKKDERFNNCDVIAVLVSKTGEKLYSLGEKMKDRDISRFSEYKSVTKIFGKKVETNKNN